jgi:hypothetical protein
MSTIHGKSHQAIKHFRKHGAALAVYWIYLSRTNKDNVAWPSIRGLVRETGFSTASCLSARQWLVTHGVLERVEGYIRPQWRNLEKQILAQKINLDRNEYYRPSGVLIINEDILPLLYISGDEPSTVEDEAPDVLTSRTSNGSNVGASETELNINKTELDSRNDSNASLKSNDALVGGQPADEKQEHEKAEDFASFVAAIEIPGDLVIPPSIKAAATKLLNANKQAGDTRKATWERTLAYQQHKLYSNRADVVLDPAMKKIHDEFYQKYLLIYAELLNRDPAKPKGTKKQAAPAIGEYPLFDAVSRLWGYDKKDKRDDMTPITNGICNQLRGRCRTGERSQYNLNPPVDVKELIAYYTWREDIRSGMMMPEKGESLWKSIMEFRHDDSHDFYMQQITSGNAQDGERAALDDGVARSAQSHQRNLFLDKMSPEAREHWLAQQEKTSQ